MASISFKFFKQIRSKLVPSSSETSSSSSAAVNFPSKDVEDGETATEDYRSKKSIIALDREKGFQDAKKDDDDSAIVIPPLQNTLNLLGESPNDEYSIAKMALLEDVRKFKEGENTNNDDSNEADLKRKIRVEEKMDFKRTNLPESSAEVDYDDIPVECFGKALLRGMGWREGRPIGRSSQKVVKPWITEPRPRGLGLGAESQKSKSIDEKQDGDQKSTSMVKKGSFVKIVKNGQYGVVVGVDNEGARLYVKLRDNEKEILNLAQFAVQSVQKLEYDAKNENVSKSIELASRKNRNGSDKISKSLKTASWLFADLKVRLIDRKSKYFKEKMIILDVTTPENCNCRLISNQKILDDLHFTKLETIVPRDRGAEVKILTGRYKGRLGKLMERDSKKSEAMIRLFDHETEKILCFPFDDICEFVGHSND